MALSHVLRVALLHAALTVSSHVAGAQSSAPTAFVSVTGAVAKPLTLTTADLSTLPRTSVTVVSNGISTTYDGVLLHEVLKSAGVPFGSGMRGSALAGYVVAAASDGYRVVFSLGELDPDLTDGQYLLADHANGKPLFGEAGAFRLLVPRDKRGARSVRMLSTLTVEQLRK